MKKGSFWPAIRDNLGAIVLFAAVAALFLFGLSDAQKNSLDEGKRIAEESIVRAAVTCYSIEGSYPPSFEYIKSRYGVRIDESRYAVLYEIFAENIMPDITVIDLKGTDR